MRPLGAGLAVSRGTLLAIARKILRTLKPVLGGLEKQQALFVCQFLAFFVRDFAARTITLGIGHHGAWLLALLLTCEIQLVANKCNYNVGRALALKLVNPVPGPNK